MHDIHLARKILNTILNYATKHNLAKITTATIELGQIEEHGQIVSNKNLAFNIKMLAKNTIAQNIKLNIILREQSNKWNLVEINGK